MIVFCEAVRRRILLLGMSQNELAGKMGVASGHLSNLLNGKSGNCSLSTCDKIAAGLGTTTADLLNGRD